RLAIGDWKGTPGRPSLIALRIPQRLADVALEALELGALDGAPAEACAEGVEVELGPFPERGVGHALGGVEQRLGGGLPELVLGACGMAHVAGVGRRAGLLGEVGGEGLAAVHDGPVGDAAGAVDLVRRGEGAGGAGVEAAGAGAAVVGAEGVV